MSDQASRIAELIRTRLSQRKPGASICPSEVGRSLESAHPDWRALMPAVRDVATSMARDGEICITQGQEQIDPTRPFNGPVRLRRGPTWRA